jgi:2-haloalkanoic acid dehalogenase type II
MELAIDRDATTQHQRLSDFSVLSFDCYGTLIDWERGISNALRHLIQRAGLSGAREEALEAFARHESAQEITTPGMRYSELLGVVFRRLAQEWGVEVSDVEALAFGRSVPAWPAFDDSASALNYLKDHYQLIVLSNVDRESFRASNERLEVRFDAVFTAQDVGTYKPDPRNFSYLRDRAHALGYDTRDVLHVAQSLYHDHEPAVKVGFATAWIDRRYDTKGWGATLAPFGPTAPAFRFNSMAELVRRHQRESAGRL